MGPWGHQWCINGYLRVIVVSNYHIMVTWKHGSDHQPQLELSSKNPVFVKNHPWPPAAKEFISHILAQNARGKNSKPEQALIF